MVLYYDDKGDDVYSNAYLTGMNIKYKDLEEDEGVPVKNKDGEVIDNINGVMPDLKRVYRDDLKTIHDFLVEKKFTKQISIDDVNDLVIKDIDKQVVVDMFNEALESNVEFGKYGNYSSNCIQKIDKNGNTIQLSYLIEYGNIVAFHVEYLYADGSRLSQKSETELKEIQKQIDAYEDEVIATQDVNRKSNISLEELNEGIHAIVTESFHEE